jgi:hypothetical protein
MTRPTIDIHAHILDPEAIRLMQREIPSVAPVLTPIDDDFADLYMDYDEPYKEPVHYDYIMNDNTWNLDEC